MEKTEKCPVCGKPYKVYSEKSCDQSACPSCKREAAENMSKANQNKGLFKTGTSDCLLDV